MNYTEKKTDDILCNVGRYLVHKDAIRLTKEINFTLKEIQRDTRHKVSECLIDNYQEYPFLADRLNQIVMNTYLD